MIRRIPIATGLFAAVIGAAWLTFWLSGRHDIAAPRTNTCVGLILLGSAIAFRARGHDLASALGILAAIVGGATLAEYVSGVDLGIDELLVQDRGTGESVRFPNRMAPNSALSFLLGGIAVALLHPSRRRSLVAVGQAYALTALTVGFLAIIGHLYGASALYQPTSLIRMTSWTSLAIVASMIGLLATRPDVGIARVLVADGPGGLLLRRLLPIGLLVPVLAGLMEVSFYEAHLMSEQTAAAFVAVTTGSFVTVVSVMVAWSVEDVHRKRVVAQEMVSRSEILTSALALAATVDEVAKATLETGVPALEASGGAIFLLEGRELRTLRARGYEGLSIDAFARIPLDAPYPAAVAARERRAVFTEKPADFSRENPSVRPASTHQAWVSLPLEGRDRLLGVLGLSFETSRGFDDATRSRLQRLAWQCGQALDRALLYDSEKTARGRAESASAAKDQFLAMLGHELRNPLSPILTSLQLMKMQRPEPHREREVIERQVQHMVRLVDDLLDISRITQGKVVLQKQPIEVGKVVAAAIETSSPLLERKRHQLEVDVAPDLWVDADSQRLAQVVANLVTNAAKYTDAGGKIAVTAKREGSDAVIRVRDNGVGISPSLLPHVFDRFVQAEQTIDRSVGGLGLGLAIARSLAAMHGGRVSATSDGIGKGSEFAIALPAYEGARTVVMRDGDAHAPAVRPADSALDVLVVDDNIDAATTLSDALRSAGHHVRTAFDGPSALAMVATALPDLAFLDLGLPVMDGFEVARRLRSAAGTRAVRLVAVTGYGQAADRDRAAAAGFDHHLVKPVALEVVLALAAGDGPAPAVTAKPRAW